MAYNPYGDLSEIYKRKQNWINANNSGDEEAKKRAAEEAKKYYASLSANGYGTLSDEMSGAGLDRAKQLVAQYGMSGKSPVREYYYSLGKGKGLSKNDIDSLIGWNNDTGEITFGGKNVGKPDSVIDGVSYIADTSVLDNSFNDYINRAGVTRSKSTAVDQENEKLFDRYGKTYDDLLNTNPFTTDEAKAIMGKYDLSALQGRDNAVASGAGANGGNIDSFAAANALRQQSALINQGQMAVLSAHQQKLDHARNLLSDMGVNIERVFNEDETAKNNDVARKKIISDVTGYSPDEWVVSNNPYMNDDGTIKDQYKNLDFAALMQKAKDAGNDEGYKNAAVARFYKMMGDYGTYGQYDNGNYIVPGRQITEPTREFNEQINQADRALGIQKEMNAENNATQLTLNAMKNQDTPKTVDNALTWDNVDAWAAQYGDDAAEDYIKENYKNLGYSNVSQALAGYKNYKTQSGAADANITNSHGDSWIHVNGFGRLSYEELVSLIDSGKVKEIYNEETNSYTYVKAG